MWEGLERERERREACFGEKTPPLGRPWATIESEWGERQRKEGKKEGEKTYPGTEGRENEGKCLAGGGKREREGKVNKREGGGGVPHRCWHCPRFWGPGRSVGPGCRE